MKQHVVAIPSGWDREKEKEKWGPALLVFGVISGETRSYLNGILSYSGYKIRCFAETRNRAQEIARKIYRKKSFSPPATHENAGNIERLHNRIFDRIF